MTSRLLSYASVTLIATMALVSGLLIGYSRGQITSDNLAIDLVHAIDENAKCHAFYADAGDEHVYSAICTFSNKDVQYCSISAGKKIESCQMITAGPETMKAQAEAQAKAHAQPVPAPTPTPEEPSKPSPAP